MLTLLNKSNGTSTYPRVMFNFVTCFYERSVRASSYER